MSMQNTGDEKQLSTDAQGVLAPHNLPYQMRLLVQSLTRRFQSVLEPYNLTPLHWGILSCLWVRDGQPTQAIAHRLEQLGGTVTVGLDSMQKRGLVYRRPDTDDRRISRVWLTPKGAALEEQLRPPVAALVEQMFCCFSVEEQAALNSMVTRLREHVEQIP